MWPEKQSVPKNGVAIIVCEHNSHIWWIHNGDKTNEAIGFGDKLLIIPLITKKHEGTYICVTYNGTTEEVLGSAQLTVIRKLLSKGSSFDL